MTLGFDWGFIGSGSDITITVKNQFPIPVVIQVNNNYAGNIPANSSFKISVGVNQLPVKIDIWGYENPKIIATKTFPSLTRGQDVIWATGNVEMNPIAPAPAPFAPPAATPPPSQPTAPPGQVQTLIPPAAKAGGRAPFDLTPSVLRNSTTSYVVSSTWLNYQGKDVQNVARRASLTKIERAASSTGATYAVSGRGGIQVGSEFGPAFFSAKPLILKRSAADNRLSSDLKSMAVWLGNINETLSRLRYKRMALGAWEETVFLPDDDSFPKAIQARFRARPLPAPDEKWIAIAAETGLITFKAIDEKAPGAAIYGRYQGVLVYSPAENAFNQAAAVLTLYQEDNQFRIEQVHFAADAKGNPLYPALDVGSYLNLKDSAPKITIAGAFPTWCVQASQIFSLLHMAVMTAAEGSTNPFDVDITPNELEFNKLAWQSYKDTGDLLEQSNALNNRLGAWIKAVEFIFRYRNNGYYDAMTNLIMDIAPGIIFEGICDVAMIAMPQWAFAIKCIQYGTPLALMAYNYWKTYNFYNMMKDLAPPEPAPTTPRPSITQPIPAAPPPDVVKPSNTAAADSGSIMDDMLLPLLLVAAGGGAYLLANGLKDCSPNHECGTSGGIGAVVVFVPEGCDCPSGSSIISGYTTTSGGKTFQACGCR